MKITPKEAEQLNHAPAIAMYPGSSLEILGYTSENGENYAFTRKNDRVRKVLIRYNEHDEPYCSLLINGRRERVYLSDCRRVVH